jgi:signal transduction histidine kinase
MIRRFDMALAAAVLVASVIETLLAKDLTGPRWAVALISAAMSLTLLWRRTHPVAAAIALAVIAVPGAALVTDPSQLVAPFIPLLVLAYGGGAYLDSRAAWTVLVTLVAGTAAVGAGADSGDATNVVFPAILTLLCWLAGRTVRVRNRHAAELHETAALAAEQREREAQQAVVDERRRIAREMHDVVAHSISIMVVQAGGARRILHSNPARAEEAAARIRHAGSDALAEMDILLGVLDAAPTSVTERTLEDLGDLVERARAGGLPVTLHVDGARRALPAGAEPALYRVAQEALTNAIKHAGGATTRVELRWGGDALELRVSDRGDGGASPGLTGSGHGLTGMRERLRLHGGDVEAGPRAGGGFEVVARLPLDRAEAVVT